MNKFIYYIAIFVMFFCCKLIKMLLKLPLPPLSVGGLKSTNNWFEERDDAELIIGFDGIEFI